MWLWAKTIFTGSETVVPTTSDGSALPLDRRPALALPAGPHLHGPPSPCERVRTVSPGKPPRLLPHCTLLLVPVLRLLRLLRRRPLILILRPVLHVRLFSPSCCRGLAAPVGQGGSRWASRGVRRLRGSVSGHRPESPRVRARQRPRGAVGGEGREGRGRAEPRVPAVPRPQVPQRAPRARGIAGKWARGRRRGEGQRGCSGRCGGSRSSEGRRSRWGHCGGWR